MLVFERRSQSHTNQINHSTNQEERRSESQRDYIQDLAITPPENAESEPGPEENKPPEAGGSRAEVDRDSGDSPAHSAVPTSVEEVEQREILESMDAEEATVLRRRRLEFFQNRPETESTGTNLEEVEINSTLNYNENTTTTTETAAETSTINQEDTASRTDTTKTAEKDGTDTTNTAEEDDIRIKLKYINDDLKLVNGKLQEPLGDFKRRHFELELSSNKLVRLIFKGQVLQRDELSLQSCGLYDNCVVHCLVHQKKSNNTSDRITTSNANLGAGNSIPGADSSRPRIPTNNQQPGREWDLGNLFFAIVSFVLGAAWYFR